MTLTTGYIGGGVVSRLLTLPNAQSKYEFRAIVRNPDKAKLLAEKFGVKTIVGSHSDRSLMEKEAAQADVVLAMVSIDNKLTWVFFFLANADVSSFSRRIVTMSMLQKVSIRG